MIPDPTKNPISCIIAPTTTTNGLFLGSIAAASDKDLLFDMKINTVITVHTKNKLRYHQADKITHKVFVADDLEFFDISQYF